MNFWKPFGFICTWKCRKVHVDISDMRSHELICMISSTHMINIYVCHALVSCLTWETLTVQNYWHVGLHSTPIMTIYTITVDSGCWSNMHMQIFAYLWIVKSNIWPWSWGIRYFEKLLKQLTPCNMYTVQVRRKKRHIALLFICFHSVTSSSDFMIFFHFQMKHVM